MIRILAVLFLMVGFQAQAADFVITEGTCRGQSVQGEIDLNTTWQALKVSTTPLSGRRAVMFQAIGGAVLYSFSSATSENQGFTLATNSLQQLAVSQSQPVYLKVSMGTLSNVPIAECK